MTAAVEDLAKRLEPFGACPEGVVDLRKKATPDGVPYLDLIQAKDRTGVPDGVVETRGDGRGEPLAYVADVASGPEPPNLPLLLKTVTLRADAPYLVIIEPGRLTVYDSSWRDDPKRNRLETVPLTADRARTTFQRLNLALIAGEQGRWELHELLYELMTTAIDQLIDSGIGRHDAISLVGRALFLRFLIDRRIVGEAELGEICPTANGLEDVFSGPRRAAATCQWLDRTFNGDFLPLSLMDRQRGFRAVSSEAFGPLADILHRAPGGQRLLDWGDLDFAHLPIGLLSQVYERQARAWDPSGQRRKSLYYTPHRIADLMTQEAFANLRERGSCPPDEARVLDPAVGGGVFLVTALQEIVAEWWRRYGRPPDTRMLRTILYRQLTGFEINEAALRLAALSLYLKVIELDLDPHPPSKLRFEPLRGKVLHSVLDPGEDSSAGVLGSLGPAVTTEHDGAYDLVIGNPPWTSLASEEGLSTHRQTVARLRPIVAARLGDVRAEGFSIPDHVPDLPFVWRALQWAKPQGWIAFALHGRLLFKSFQGGRKAREDLFQAVRVTGVLNGADLRKTAVWPNVTTPFCLLFAINLRPKRDDVFYLTSPYHENNLNRQGRLRIDAKARYPIALGRILARPHLLKTLYRGTALDAAVLDKVQAPCWPSIGLTFDKSSGGGYKVGGKEQQEPDFLSGMPDLTTDYAGSILLDPARLPQFSRDHVHRRRRRQIYEGPLVIVRKSMPHDRERGRAFLAFSDVAYNWSFFGYSARHHPAAVQLARYLILLLHSELFLWHALVTSSQFGVERDSLLKEDVDDFPLRPVEDLEPSLEEAIEPLLNALLAGQADWSALDRWAADVYGLSRWDREVVHDSLHVGSPFHQAEKEAQRPPNDQEIAAFGKRLEHELLPFVGSARHQVVVRRLPGTAGVPWEVLEIDAPKEAPSPSQTPEPTWMEDLFAQADQEGASQIMLRRGSRLLLGILRQYRFWTPSRARLCALEVLQGHLGDLLGGE